MSDRAVLYFELLEWLEVSEWQLHVPLLSTHFSIDDFKSRSISQYDGHANYGCSIRQIGRFPKVKQGQHGFTGAYHRL